MGPGRRWLVAVGAALGCFGGCWAGLAAEQVLDTGTRVGVASVPLVVILAVLGAWAERAREKTRGVAGPAGGMSARAGRSPQAQVTGLVSGGVVIGPGSSLENPVFHLGVRDDQEEAPLRGEPERPLGSVPRVWNLPTRNLGFTGRDGLLVAVRERLLAGDRTVVQAFQGMGGVGKTQLAIEYAYRFAGTYDLAWWINSEQAGLIGDQVVSLGAALGCVPPGVSMEAARTAVLGELRERVRWLLIFDNAERLADITAWLPGGTGHVLITSRARTWNEVAVPIEVDVLARDESVTLLQDRLAELGVADADRLADKLGDLPLAIAQAAGFMADTGMPAAQYLDLMETQAGTLLDQAAAGSSYPRSLAAVTRLAVDRLNGEDPAAAQLADICAFLAPEPIPDDLFTNAPGELAARVADPLTWRQTLALLARQSLARIDQHGIVMHRLTQAILRDRLTTDQAAAVRARTEAILAANNPGDPDLPANWPGWTRLLPHLLFLDPASTRNADLRRLACSAATYLVGHGDAPAGHDLARDLYRQWHDRFGPDDDCTLWIQSVLAYALREMRRHEEARELDEDNFIRRREKLGEDSLAALNAATNLAGDLGDTGDYQAARILHEETLDRKRRVLGEDHPITLNSMNNLGLLLEVLGETREARRLFEDTLARRRRVLGADHPETLKAAANLGDAEYELRNYQKAKDLQQENLTRRRRALGEDHPHTLHSANNLAVSLYALGSFQAARDLDEDTLARRRRLRGEDHPDTLRSAGNLAVDLHGLGNFEAARKLDEDTLARERRVLGPDHLRTLVCANNLAADLRALGEAEAARELEQDTLHRCRRVLGDDHPYTVRSARNLAEDLRALGEADGPD